MLQIKNVTFTRNKYCINFRKYTSPIGLLLRTPVKIFKPKDIKNQIKEKIANTTPNLKTKLINSTLKMYFMTKLINALFNL